MTFFACFTVFGNILFKSWLFFPWRKVAPYFHFLGSSVCWSNTLDVIFCLQDLAKIDVNYKPTTQLKVFGPQDNLKYMMLMYSCSLPSN